MPVLESTDDKIVPRSILRHRSIGEKSAPGGKRSTTATTPAVQRASRPQPQSTGDQVEVDEWERTGDEEEVEVKTPARRASATTSHKALPKSPPRTPLPGTGKGRISIRHAHPLLYLGIGMILMLALWTLVMAAVGWVNRTMDDIHYGYPRTYQTDAFVGHNEANGVPTHFIAINLHGHIEVIEIPGGDASKARIYEGPQLYTSNADLVPVTLKFVHINGDHLPDMLVCFQGSQLVYINDGQSFHPMSAAERQQVEQFLQNSGQSC